MTTKKQHEVTTEQNLEAQNSKLWVNHPAPGL